MSNTMESQASEAGQSDGTSWPSPHDTKLSITSLITWNISKVTETAPSIDLRAALRSTHDRLEGGSRDGEPARPRNPQESYLTCALLAWQRLGHEHTESLYDFVQANRNESSKESSGTGMREVFKGSSSSVFKSYAHRKIGGASFASRPFVGPVIKLPAETKIVMRLDTIDHDRKPPPKKSPTSEKALKAKLDDACCKDRLCAEKLAEVDAATDELRSRAEKLAKRESERMGLLERAEAAWKDLELAYMRRLNEAEEKESLLGKKIKASLEERNGHKNGCPGLSKILQEQAELAEKKRDSLKEIEGKVYARACERLQLSEQSSLGEAAVAQQHCQITQLDRELQFKEDHARRKISSLESEIECVRGLMFEAERAMRSDLSTIKDQVKLVSDGLMTEETTINKTQEEVKNLNETKNQMIEDLDSCKIICDKRMQNKLDDLKSKRSQVAELKQKVLDCRCRLPQDVAVEVKRTPSLALLCSCTPDEKFLDSCSCTSLRSQLMSNLLGDLFGGLQSELDEHGSLMPCQLLKCLEDRHNWDRPSAVQSNLRDHFSKLLIGELDIAIATALEKYQAKWVGSSCVDVRCCEAQASNEASQENCIERRAQKLANEMAQQLFQEKADELTERAKRILSDGSTPCQCKPQQAAVFPCLVKSPGAGTRRVVESSFIKRALQDVTQLRVQIEDLKKESIKKEDLRHMEDKITRLVNRARKLEPLRLKNKNKYDQATDVNNNDKEEPKVVGHESRGDEKQKTKRHESTKINSKTIKTCHNKNKIRHIEKNGMKSIFRKVEQSYAVNLCLCGEQEISKDVTNVFKISSNQRKQSLNACNPRQTKSNSQTSKDIENGKGEKSGQLICPSKCLCFHKIPSNTSINKLLDTLTTWNSNCDQYKTITTMKSDKSKLEADINSNVPQNLISIYDNNNYFKSLGNRQPQVNYVENNTNTLNDNLVVNTVSEYMGAINLEKSNENFCKCVINKTKGNDYFKKEDVLNVKNLYNKKCLRPESDKVFNHDQASEKTSVCDENHMKIGGDSFTSDIMEKSDKCKYCVKLLGVTLTEPTNNNNIPPSRGLIAPSAQLRNTCPNMTGIKYNNYEKSSSLTRKRCNLSTCKYGEALEAISLKESIKSDRDVSSKKNNSASCICCKKKESNDDIEVNAYKLLEDHLKEKMNKLKLSCDNITISATEEENIFSSILDKVKQFITNSTSELSCKCLFENREGSWSRAYGLLIEYLKMKFFKAQCSCSKNKNTPDKVLPTVLEKVNALIESDFEVLKNKYKNENKNVSTIFRNSKNQTSNDKMCRCKNEVCTQSDLIDQALDERRNSRRNIDNVSAQVSFNLNSQDKSCDPIVTIENDIKKFEKNVSCKIGKNYYVTDCDCRYALIESTITEKPFKSLSAHNDIWKHLNSEQFGCKKIVSHESYSDSKLKIPYIGYTLSCPCERLRLSQRSYSKSITNINNKQINYIWQSITSQQFPNSVSYIMNGAPVIKSSLKIETDKLLENDEKNRKNALCKNTNTYNNESVILKKSTERNNANYRDRGTLYDMISNYIIETSGYKVHYENQDTSVNKKVLFGALDLPTGSVDQVSNYNDYNSTDKTCDSLLHTCDCENVPICHVKMLVEDINRKLLHSECICDSLSANVCPLHSNSF